MEKPIKTRTTKLMLFLNFVSILLLVVGLFSIIIPIAYGLYILFLLLLTIVTLFLLLLNERFRSLFAVQPNMEMVFLIGNIGFIGAALLSLSTLIYFILYKRTKKEQAISSILVSF